MCAWQAAPQAVLVLRQHCWHRYDYLVQLIAERACTLHMRYCTAAPPDDPHASLLYLSLYLLHHHAQHHTLNTHSAGWEQNGRKRLAGNLAFKAGSLTHMPSSNNSSRSNCSTS